MRSVDEISKRNTLGIVHHQTLSGEALTIPHKKISVKYTKSLTARIERGKQ